MRHNQLPNRMISSSAIVLLQRVQELDNNSLWVWFLPHRDLECRLRLQHTKHLFLLWSFQIPCAIYSILATSSMQLRTDYRNKVPRARNTGNIVDSNEGADHLLPITKHEDCTQLPCCYWPSINRWDFPLLVAYAPRGSFVAKPGNTVPPSVKVVTPISIFLVSTANIQEAHHLLNLADSPVVYRFYRLAGERVPAITSPSVTILDLKFQTTAIGPRLHSPEGRAATIDVMNVEVDSEIIPLSQFLIADDN